MLNIYSVARFSAIGFSLNTLLIFISSIFVACGEDESADTQTANLQGTVTLSAMLEEDKQGTLYIALFEEDPAADLSNPPIEVDGVIIEMADFSDMDTSFTFNFNDITMRAEPYYVTALLDLNENAAETSLPDKGDIISLMGQASPSIVIDQSNVEMMLDLNFIFPF